MHNKILHEKSIEKRTRIPTSILIRFWVDDGTSFGAKIVSKSIPKRLRKGLEEDSSSKLKKVQGGVHPHGSGSLRN